jgi:hypothetical protein
MVNTSLETDYSSAWTAARNPSGPVAIRRADRPKCLVAMRQNQCYGFGVWENVAFMDKPYVKISHRPKGTIDEIPILEQKTQDGH